MVVLLICIPSYFYLQSEIENHQFNENTLLKEYGLSIQRAIYDFNHASENIFNFPKSFSIQAKLYNKNNQLIYASKPDFKHQDISTQEFLLSTNRLNGFKLILSKSLDYQIIYLKIGVLTLCIGLFIFLSAIIILQQSIQPYKQTNKYLNMFFNDAMHELKTPLGIIQLNLELLQTKITEQKEIQRCLNGVKSLNNIYEDIEYFIKQKSITYNKETIDFSSYLKSRIEEFESIAFSKQIVLQQNIQENIFIDFNRTELQRIIDNTLSNAIKYSHNNSNIHINLSKKETTVLSITDFGQGIEDTSRIFERYYREEKIKGGFGLGLNIVKKICDKNSVNIEVSSKTNEGSTFTYQF